ncbi:metallophosphoesterase family protein [Ruegeria lacuscaerulensis]|uniref:metallophosphoesterase family protein n=1 Tax=Ruegeria lacuscaerulensis TaxID=55218 RepID=UPI00147EE1B6|nr:metallophosphoesterase family protein [Ruegeria lacuscaerulensis]
MLSSLFQRFGWRAAFSTPTPESPICVIGDVHGCIVQLEKLLPKIPQDHRVVLVGDYIDRGEYSADVLRLISEHTEFTCLKGNHEDMLLQFLEDPEKHGRRWLHYGGMQTLASFGLRGIRPEMNRDELQECRDRLQEVMGDALNRWLKSLRTHELSGNVLVAHAGADPIIAPGLQSDKALIWGHPGFQTVDRRDGIWVVHGHTIVTETTARRGRIAIDTGAYATGLLSAVCLDGTEPRFISAR